MPLPVCLSPRFLPTNQTRRRDRYRPLLTLLFVLASLVAIPATADTVYSNAEDGTTGWRVYDDKPSGAEVRVEFDEILQSNVIQTSGANRDNGYMLGGTSEADGWNNTSEFHVNWRLQADQNFAVYVRVDTQDGWRYLTYTQANTDGLESGNGRYIRFGLGSRAKDGNWYVFSRDLAQDLAKAQPNNPLIAVHGFLVRGSIRLDDITLSAGPVTQTILPPVSSTVNATAEDGILGALTGGWRVFDDNPAGAMISVVTDETTGSEVYQLAGAQRSNGYQLGGLDTLDGWNNQTDSLFSWDMQVSEAYQVLLRVETALGLRYLVYTQSNSDGLLNPNGVNIAYGLGSGTRDGQWRTHERDLAADVTNGEPGNSLLAVHGLFVRGSMRIDNIRLSSSPAESVPPLAVITGGPTSVTVGDSLVLDGLGSSDDSSIVAYQWTNAAGEVLGEESQLTLVTTEAGSFTVTLTVTDDSDLQGSASVDITVQELEPPNQPVYEDAEDASTARWIVSDATPTGASIENLADSNRGSRVIRLNGSDQLNAFLIGYYNGSRDSSWNNTEQTLLRWSMQTDAGFSVYVHLSSAQGDRILIYDQYNGARGSATAANLRFGLGSSAYDGNWQTFTRNLEADLQTLQPDNSVVAVHGMQFRGSFGVDDIEMPTIVDSAPVAVLTVDPIEGVGQLSATLDASGSTDDTGIVSYRFDFGDGSEPVTSDVSSVSHVYATVGEYLASVTVTDTAYQTSTSNAVTITVLEEPEPQDTPPVAAFSVAQPITGSTVSFVNESSDDDEIASVLWNFGDATESGQSNQENPVYTYSAIGDYTVTLTVVDSVGQMDTATQVISIETLDEEPVELSAAFSASALSGEAPLAVTLDASETGGGQGALSYQWLVEQLDEAGEPLTGGASISGEGVTFDTVLSVVGVYRVSLTVIDELDAAATATLDVTVTGDEPPVSDVTPGEAARLLAQASFGASSDSIARVQALGMEGWIEEQFTQQGPPHLDFVLANSNGSNQEARHEIWWRDVVDGEDQLRQRVAFALSQIFVISDQGYTLGNAQYGVTRYYDQLREQAFGNYRQLLETVTLSPVMGVYLSMLQNEKGDEAGNTRADENFAREVLQLFSIGLHELNLDGTAKRAGGQSIPAFTQAHVEDYARVFTGWNFANANSWTLQSISGFADKRSPMEPWPQYHDDGAKTLLGGVTAQAGLSPEADLDLALDTIANHPNVGPFISRQLIQKLVTSNPTPGYVARVASVFNDNGAGVRGDLRAVVKTILLDSEAREGHLNVPDFGKLREPVLRLSHLWRAFDVTPGSQSVNGVYNTRSPHVKDLNYLSGQAVLKSPSVFNFFQPDYAPLGPIYATGKLAPEAEIYTDNMILAMTTRVNTHIQYVHDASDTNAKKWAYINLAEERALAGVSTAALLDRLNLLLLSGGMSDGLRSVLTNHLESLPSAATEDGQSRRVRDALSLIMASPDYLVQM